MSKTISGVETEDCIIVVQGTVLDGADWSAYTAWAREAAATRQPKKILVCSAGSALTAKQRAEVNSIYSWKPTLGICSVSSPLTRGTVTALSWLMGANMRMFGYDALDECMTWLDIPVSRHVVIKERVWKEQIALGFPLSRAKAPSLAS